MYEMWEQACVMALMLCCSFLADCGNCAEKHPARAAARPVAHGCSVNLLASVAPDYDETSKAASILSDAVN